MSFDAVVAPRERCPQWTAWLFCATFKLMASRSESLDALSTKFEDLLKRMQTPFARMGMETAFHATPAELARAAVKARRDGGAELGGTPP